MPPHCDTLDGPVAKAVRLALETGNVNHMLIWAPKTAEPELKEAFAMALRARGSSKEAEEIADLWLLENVVRLHREGEGAPYTGLKPADLDWGPVVPLAERSITSKNPNETINFMVETLKNELENRFAKVMEHRVYDLNDVDAGRAYVQAELGFVLFSHDIYTSITGKGGHEEEGTGAKGHTH